MIDHEPLVSVYVQDRIRDEFYGTGGHCRADEAMRRVDDSHFCSSRTYQCRLSTYLFTEIVTRSLQSPHDNGHHDGAIGAGQHRQLRCRLEFGQKLCRF